MKPSLLLLTVFLLCFTGCAPKERYELVVSSATSIPNESYDILSSTERYTFLVDKWKGTVWYLNNQNKWINLGTPPIDVPDKGSKNDEQPK